jgi:8-oxo-dGTP pyrophosphatase MutT (NUDIX family)
MDNAHTQKKGPRIRTDIVDVYVARRGALGLEFLQLRRAKEPLRGSWQPIMGHVEAGETAVQTAKREAKEEVGLAGSGILGLWQLEQVHPFYIASSDEIVMSPRFVAEVGLTWKPVLNSEHSEFRWVQESKVGEMFVWPGQRAAIAEAGRVLRGDVGEEGLRVG